MAGLQVTAIISPQGETVRPVLPWPLYYRYTLLTDLTREVLCVTGRPSRSDSCGAGGSCDTTPATPDSLVTDSELQTSPDLPNSVSALLHCTPGLMNTSEYKLWLIMSSTY